MLAHRRWPNINPTLGQRLVFAGYAVGSLDAHHGCGSIKLKYKRKQKTDIIQSLIYSKFKKVLFNILANKMTLQQRYLLITI